MRIPFMGSHGVTAARNSLRDAAINEANFQISKDTNVTERVKIRVDAAFQNVFNHPNFSSVDPFIEDAGNTSENVGFATPSLFSGGNRVIKFGLKVPLLTRSSGSRSVI